MPLAADPIKVFDGPGRIIYGMKKTFVQLQELFSQLSSCAGNSTTDVNPCGECNSCCHAETMKFHKVSPLEFDYLEEMVGKKKTDRFRDYIKRKKDSYGGLLYEVCPNYGEGGCTVHDYRPYSCRMFGSYRTDREKMPSYCVFKDTAVVIPHEERLDLLPGNRELQKLLVDYFLEGGVEDDFQDSEFDESTADLPTLATYYLSKGEYEKAVPVLEYVVVNRPDEAIHKWQMAEAYEGCGRREEALVYFQQAVEMAPDNATYQAELAGCLFWLGRGEEAAGHYQLACELNPKRASVHGMLGICHMNAGRLVEADQCFRRALGCEQQPTIFRYQFAQLLYRQGQTEDARELFELALECPHTANDAETALKTLF